MHLSPESQSSQVQDQLSDDVEATHPRRTGDPSELAEAPETVTAGEPAGVDIIPAFVVPVAVLPDSPATIVEHPTPKTSTGPFGGWSQAELRSLPRFPHRDSFPMAKGLIHSFLFQDDDSLFSFRDLRIVMFWLGFGLQEMPTLAEPTLGLSPLCKDLDAFADSALELGYDPMASVHGRPVALADAGSNPPLCSTPLLGMWPRLRRGKANGKYKAKARNPVACTAACTSSSSAGSSSSTSAAGVLPTSGNHGRTSQGTGSDCPWPASGTPAWAQNSPTKPLSHLDEDVAAESDDIFNQWVTMSSDDEIAHPWSYKVKLLHAGGWSSGSDGQNSPPQQHALPGGSSSAHGPTQEHGQSNGGLGLDHMEQFTVSFVSDLQLHEDLEETSLLCTFCLDEMQIGEELCRLPCMHTFHRGCVHAWLARDRRCMLCRLDVTRPRG